VWKKGPRIPLAVAESLVSAASLNVISSTSLQYPRIRFWLLLIVREGRRTTRAQ
jgi:hypothetical protein